MSISVSCLLVSDMIILFCVFIIFFLPENCNTFTFYLNSKRASTEVSLNKTIVCSPVVSSDWVTFMSQHTEDFISKAHKQFPLKPEKINDNFTGSLLSLMLQLCLTACLRRVY